MGRAARTPDTPAWDQQDADLAQLWNDGWEADVIGLGLGRSKIAIEVRAARRGLPKRAVTLKVAQERAQRRVDRCLACGLCTGDQVTTDQLRRVPKPLLPSAAGWRSCLPCLSNGKKTEFWSPNGGVRRCPQCEKDPAFEGLSWLDSGTGRF